MDIMNCQTHMDKISLPMLFQKYLEGTQGPFIYYWRGGASNSLKIQKYFIDSYLGLKFFADPLPGPDMQFFIFADIPQEPFLGRLQVKVWTFGRTVLICQQSGTVVGESLDHDAWSIINFHRPLFQPPPPTPACNK